jgi:flagellar assembly factor FliW
MPDEQSAPETTVWHDLPVIAFPLGLPGFPGATRFTLERADRWSESFLIMRPSADPAIRFLMLPCADDALPLRRADLEAACAMHGLSRAQVAVLLVVTLQAEREGRPEFGFCVNLRAPVLLDTGQAVAVQHIMDSPDYAVRHPLARAA